MEFLLDTNACVDYLTGRYPSVIERIQGCDPQSLGLSSVVVAELRYGAAKSQHRRKNNERINTLVRQLSLVPFDIEAAHEFGKLRADLERRGLVLGPYDMLIASQALAAGSVLVTDNLREFERVPGLAVENWRSANGGQS